MEHLKALKMEMLMPKMLLMMNMMIMTICLFLQVGRPHGNLVFFKPTSFPLLYRTWCRMTRLHPNPGHFNIQHYRNSTFVESIFWAKIDLNQNMRTVSKELLEKWKGETNRLLIRRASSLKSGSRGPLHFQLTLVHLGISNTGPSLNHYSQEYMHY